MFDHKNQLAGHVGIERPAVNYVFNAGLVGLIKKFKSGRPRGLIIPNGSDREGGEGAGG